jgi:uncharacterized membrane protein
LFNFPICIQANKIRPWACVINLNQGGICDEKNLYFLWIFAYLLFDVVAHIQSERASESGNIFGTVVNFGSGLAADLTPEPLQAVLR